MDGFRLTSRGSWEGVRKLFFCLAAPADYALFQAGLGTVGARAAANS